MRTTMRTLGAVLVAAGSLAIAPGARAQTWTAALSGAAEAPPNGSPASGSAVVTLTGSMLRVSFSFSGLTSGTTAAHIHCCTAVPSAGTATVATVTPTFPIRLGMTSDSFTQTYDMSLVGSYNPAFLGTDTPAIALTRLVDGLNSGRAYLNVHTSQFPSGEIRGFLVTTPEPGTWALLGVGLAGVAATARRRRTRA